VQHLGASAAGNDDAARKETLRDLARAEIVDFAKTGLSQALAGRGAGWLCRSSSDFHDTGRTGLESKKIPAAPRPGRCVRYFLVAA
jgi:hypothetical protein